MLYLQYSMNNISLMLRKRTMIKWLQLVLAAMAFIFDQRTDASFLMVRQQQQQQHQQRQYSLILLQQIRMNHCTKSLYVEHRPRNDAILKLYSNDDDDQYIATTTPLRSESNVSTDNIESSSSSTSTTTLITKSIKMNNKPQKNTNGGVYVRPSAAIERGSGFFVPGLEGYKVRLFVGSIVVILTILLHYYHISTSSTSILSTDSSGDSGNKFAESLAIFYGLLVLLQGSIEARKDLLATSNDSNGNNELLRKNSNGRTVQVYQQQWSIDVSDSEWRDKVEWVASTYLSLTSATDMVLIGPGKIVFSLGTNARPNNSNDDDELRGCNGALATLAQSTSGCLSLPMNHITVQTLVLPTSTLPTGRTGIDNGIVNSVPRSVVIQRINDQLCWMMISNQLLASFTTNDLQWLGQLAQYTNPE